MRLHRASIVPALIVLALAFAACGGSDDDTSATTDATATDATATDATAEETTATDAAEETGSTPAPSGEAQRSEKVRIVEFTYVPDPVVVQTGGKVIWQNEDMAPHTATADDGSFDTGTLERGKLQAETFEQAGTFTYFCELHPVMAGTVEVVDAS